MLNEFSTADCSCTTKHFLTKLLKKFVVHIFTLLLAHFTSNLVNYYRHSETLNIRKNDMTMLWPGRFILIATVGNNPIEWGSTVHHRTHINNYGDSSPASGIFSKCCVTCVSRVAIANRTFIDNICVDSKLPSKMLPDPIRTLSWSPGATRPTSATLIDNIQKTCSETHEVMLKWS